MGLAKKLNQQEVDPIATKHRAYLRSSIAFTTVLHLFPALFGVLGGSLRLSDFGSVISSTDETI